MQENDGSLIVKTAGNQRQPTAEELRGLEFAQQFANICI